MLRMEHDVREALRDQNGVLTRVQALDAGLTDKAIAVRLRSGRWQRLHTGVYATFSGKPPREAWLWAAVLTPPRTRVEDSVLDLVETCASTDEAFSLILKASASRRTTPELILAALQRRPRMPRRAGLVRALGAAADGVHSLLEFRYVNRVERPHGLPQGRRQNPVRRGGRSEYQDLSYEEYGLVIEMDGREAHPAWFRWADIRRDNANAAVGQVTLRYGWDDVTERPCQTALEVAAALREHGWAGALRRCGARCAVR
jgi:hypothetical protein